MDLIKNKVEKRKEKRFAHRMIAKINDKPGLVENISKNGIKLCIPNLPSDCNIVLVLKNQKDSIKLKGYVRWSNEKTSMQGLSEIGISIIEPSQEFIQFIATLEEAPEKH
jgi:hypothetical protein